MAEVTALSQRPARAVPDCAEYHSACSTMSATAASLRTRRFFVTSSLLAGALAESGNQALAADFGDGEFDFRPLGGSDEFLLKTAQASLLVIFLCPPNQFADILARRSPIARSDLPFDVLFEWFRERDV